MPGRLPQVLAERLEGPTHLDGGQGGAFLARDRVGGEQVVVKRLPASPSAWLAVKVLQEAASPHLPRIVDLVREGGELWIATAYVEGETLETRLRRDGPLSAEAALRLGRDVAEALGRLVEAGTHHGDVSPANVVLPARPGGPSVLVDLGNLGAHGSGTPGYLAPEVLAGGGGPASDLFALGSVVYAALAGAPPFRRPEEVAALDAARVRRKVAALARSREIPAPLADLLERLLDPSPSARPKDPRGVAARLATMVGGDGPSGAPLVPSRWPYAGDVGRLLAGVPGDARVVLVTGPAGAGRTRTLEEIGLSLAADGRRVRRVSLAGALAGERVGDEIVLVDPVTDAGTVRALALAVVAGRVWAVADDGVAEAATDARGMVRLAVPALDPGGIKGLAAAARVADPAAWARALEEATGGAAGRVVRALE
ncbi:MAG: serine/threonine protein kinase, partial [Deltaproteobacteria bacterium]